MPGEVSEWFMEHAWKACRWPTLPRGFESRSLRHTNLRNPLLDVIFNLLASNSATDSPERAAQSFSNNSATTICAPPPLTRHWSSQGSYNLKWVPQCNPTTTLCPSIVIVLDPSLRVCWFNKAPYCVLTLQPLCDPNIIETGDRVCLESYPSSSSTSLRIERRSAAIFRRSAIASAV